MGQRRERKVDPQGRDRQEHDLLELAALHRLTGKEHPTLDKFQKKYGTKVKYIEEINDNNEFFGKVRQQYAQGNSGGRDLHVVTDWMADRMKQLGYVQKLDKSAMPNVVKNIEPAVAQPRLRPQARRTRCRGRRARCC